MLSSLSIGSGSKNNGNGPSSSAAAAASASITVKDSAAASPAAAQAMKQRSQHRSLITVVHAKTQALARTVQKYPRKHRDISSNGVLGDAVEALEEFKEVEWPPHRTDDMEVILSTEPDWMISQGRISSSGSVSGSSGRSKDEDFDTDMELVQDLEQKVSLSPKSTSITTVNDCSGEGDDKAMVGVCTSASVDATLCQEMENVDVNDEEEAKELHKEIFQAKTTENKVDGGCTNSENEGNIAVQEIESSSLSAHDAVESQGNNVQDVNKDHMRLEVIVDEEKPIGTAQPPLLSPNNTSSLNKMTAATAKVDAAAMEPMHPAVITTLHALCLVISSESKTPKMTEVALECISILTHGRYVSGIAGGRMKLEVQKHMRDTAFKPKQGHQLDQSLSDGQGHVVVGTVERLHAGAKGHDGRDGGLSFLGYVVESITRASESPSEAVQGAMAKALLAIMTCPKCGVHEAAMLQAVRSTFHVYLVGKSTSGKELAKRTLVDMLKCVFMRMEAYDIVSKNSTISTESCGDGKNDACESSTSHAPSKCGDGSSETATSTTANGSAAATGVSSNAVEIFASQYHTDSYLLFRALCKLSSKTLPGDENASVVVSSIAGFGSGVGPSAIGGSFFSSTPVVDPLALSSKILSLDLILAVFEHCGDAFKNGEKFVYAVQSYLCVSLLKNCMSHQTVVAHLSLKIFLLLVRKFKTHLKSEIEVFVANIFLRVLESPNSPFEQKVLVLEALRALCADPQMLTQLFLNYDCDFNAVNLYEDIVHHLTRISAKACAPKSTVGSGNVTKKSIDQELELSRTGLEVLVVILRSFLKSLGLPGGDDVDESDGSSFSLLRQSLKIDIGENSTADNISTERNPSSKSSDVSLDNTDVTERQSNESVISEPQSSASDVAGKIVDAFDKKRMAQQHFEIGCVKFKLSFKSGLTFFIENGFVDLDAQEVARFLFEHSEELDKTQIGEVLGKEPDAAFAKGENVDPEKGGGGFYLRVLYHYVDKMEFAGLLFDDAIRHFLSGFRLPGEAQKIDRIMEKFAERFTRQNESVFPSPDTAFILGFSVIMLNTDLHNPSIKPERRMTVESFIRNNKGIANGGDLPDEFLTGIFNRIKEKPFSLKEDDDAREKVSKESTRDLFESLFVFDGPAIFGSSAEEKKREKFRKEREEMMVASEQLFKKRPSDKNSSKHNIQGGMSQLTDSVSPADVARPMFDVTWGPLLGTLSQVLESSSNEASIALCLSGFVYSIRISSHSGMSLARNTFVNSLAKFTTLGSIKEMKSKNIECIRTLLSIAIIDGEYLGESWSPILQCISQLERLQLFASGLDSQEQFLQTEPTQLSKLSEAAREMEENNGKAVLGAINEVLIDRVFSSSVTLSARGIVSFIEQLIAVSDAEISGDTKKGISGVSSTSTTAIKGKVSSSTHGQEGPRIFSLQHLVEVADYNMNIRPRLTWSQIWETMGNHFAKVGCNENAMVSMFAIDALRQLSFKFLEKPELTDFNFQRLFLKPFLLIMKNPGSREDIRELVLRCVDNIIRTLAHNLQSGWKIFFSILTLSSSDPSVKINTLGLAILQRLLDEHLDELCLSGPVAVDGDEKSDVTLSSSARSIRNANAEDFVGLCRASLSFVQIEQTDTPLPIGLSMRALCHTACYADLIAEKKILPPVSGYQHSDHTAPGFTYQGLTDEESLEMTLWRPLLDGLASGISSAAPSISGGVGCLIQRGSVMALRAILLRHGTLFSVPQWLAILNFVILPAVQGGAESDISPVTNILSESPSVSSLDFVGEPLRFPPSCNDEGLQKFAAMLQADEVTPSRSLGTAELLAEASFADLRHGGDGNLSNAHSLKKKDVDSRLSDLQPFPNSWIATTAPVALGMLSDIVYSNFLDIGTDGREVLWPTISNQLERWSFGTSPECAQEDDATKVMDISEETETILHAGKWQPCEALVRIGCKEWSRLFRLVLDATPSLNPVEAQAWIKALTASLSGTMGKTIMLEEKVRIDIVETKLATLGILNENRQRSESEDSISKRKDRNYLRQLPVLKISCVALHCLQQCMSTFVDQFAARASEEEISCLLDTLNRSRLVSSSARTNEDLAHAFHEAFINQWGESDGVEEVEVALQSAGGGISHRGSSQIFFLTQEASATKVVILLLTSLFCRRRCNSDDETTSWDAEAFSEPLLLERMIDVLTQFILSEQNDGQSLDPNVWRSVKESGGQVAFYCTSFAGVVVDVLETIFNMVEDKFHRHEESLFPILCSLVCVQSVEIRQLVAKIFRKQIGPRILQGSKIM